MGITIRLRRDTAANWSVANPILALGEMGVVTDADPDTFKIGDGVTDWEDLPYSGGSSSGPPWVTSFLVAASDAPSDLQDQANYVCDGVNDDAEIETAYAALPASGGQILLSEGTFSCRGISLSGKTVDISGAGQGATTVQLKNSGNEHLLLLDDAAGSKIHDLTLDGNKANNTTDTYDVIRLNLSDRCHVYNCEITNASRDGVVLVGSQKCSIRNNYIHDAYTFGAWLGNNGGTYSDYTEFANNTVEDTGMDSIELASPNLLCMGNTMRSSGTRLGAGACYLVPGMTRNRIIGNHIEDANGYGIDIGPDTGLVFYGHIVQGNTVKDSVNAGVVVGMAGTTVRGNVFINSGQSSGANPYGIYVYANDVLIDGNLCTDTQVSKTQTYGIGIDAGASGTLIGPTNKLDGNATGRVTGTPGVPQFDSSVVSTGDYGARWATAFQTKIGACGPSFEAGVLFGNAGDTNLYRSAADTLKTDDTFDGAAFKVAGTSLAASHLSNGVTGSGVIVLANTPTLITPDIGAATGYTLDASSYIRANYANGANEVVIGYDGVSASGPYLIFGTNNSWDTNLYRSAANTLKTDDALTVTGTLTTGDVIVGDAKNIAVNTTTGTKIGTSTSQKLGFYNSTPIVQPGNLTLTNYSAGSRSLDRSSYSMDQLADFVAQMYTNLKNLGLIA